MAVNTIRRAVRDLRDQGLVITVPIKGTFVRGEQPPTDEENAATG